MMSKTYHFYNLSPSPWPFLSTLSSFNMMMSLILMLKTMNMTNMAMSMVLLIQSSMSWWNCMKSELNSEGKYSMNMESSFKSSMLIFILSEVMFFFSMFWTYFHFFLVPSLEVGMSWPPILSKMFNWMEIPLLNTLILVSSGMTVTMAHKMISEKKEMKYKTYMAMTIILGLLFTHFQMKEYKSSFFSMADSTFGNVFFIATGLHGIHVLIGSIYLAKNLMKISSTIPYKENLSFEMSAWYWHFVDVVWLAVFYSMYYLQN